MPEINRIEEYLHIQLAKRKMADCVDPDLYRQGKSKLPSKNLSPR